ncbi:MAG: hypothetical protein HC873_02185 [Leptolyngbyaceae cyanobacterium SL_1_1]|nr:hypothetical protein [Leptolyngbyaceae cyanobacterium RM1_1_2]NJO08643.1 hypothetical protein [Leptolyngbyaceae cyanobacterium SL_1_1]
MTALNPIINFLLQSPPLKTVSISPLESLSTADEDVSPTLQNLNSAFLILLAGDRTQTLLRPRPTSTRSPHPHSGETGPNFISTAPSR